MLIIWNKVTWYSKLAAVILALLIFGWGFYLGYLYGLRASIVVNIPFYSAAY